MPTLEMRDQTNVLCLAGYLNLSTGTFSNWRQWRKAEAATIFRDLPSRWEREWSSNQCHGKSWIMLGITGVELVLIETIHKRTSIKKDFALSSSTLPCPCTHTSLIMDLTRTASFSLSQCSERVLKLSCTTANLCVCPSYQNTTNSKKDVIYM